MNKYLSNLLSANNLISPFQSGFRRGDSAPLQLFRLTTELFAALDSRAVAAAVFYDFKKAFDSDWHRVLIRKLFSAGVSGSALGWLSHFITDCTQHVPVLALQRLVFPKVPLSAQRFSFFSLILFHLAHPVQQTALQMTPAQSHLAAVWPAIHHRSTKNPIQRHSSSHLGKRSQAHYPSREDRLHAVSPPTPPSARPQYLSKQSCHHPSPPAQAPWCYTFFHPFLVTSCRTSYLSLFCNAWSSSSSPLQLPFFISLSTKSLSGSATYALFWSMAAPLLLVCLFTLLASLKLCNRRHCPFVASILLVSLSERRSSILLRLFFSILDDNVPDHLSGFCHWPFVHTVISRTPRNSSAIRLPRPRTSLFLSSPLYLAAFAYNSSITSI